MGAVAKYWFCLVSPSLGTGLSGYKGHPPLNTVSPNVYSGHWVGFQREAGVCREREVQARVSGSKRCLRRTFLDGHQKALWGVPGGEDVVTFWAEKEQGDMKVLLSPLQLCSQEWGHSLARLSLFLLRWLCGSGTQLILSGCWHRPLKHINS